MHKFGAANRTQLVFAAMNHDGHGNTTQ
jgi:DNA-binding CsgD family transcriptional regulator